MEGTKLVVNRNMGIISHPCKILVLLHGSSNNPLLPPGTAILLFSLPTHAPCVQGLTAG